MKTVQFLLIFVLINFAVVSFGNNNNNNRWKLDARFANIDIIQMVNNSYPSLSDKAELISHYSGYYNVNPFLLSESVIKSDKQVSLVAKRLSKSIIKPQSALLNDMLLKNSDLSKVKSLMANYGINQKNYVTSIENMPAFDLPFNHQQAWFFNGVHTWTGDDDGTAMSSIDITRGWGSNWGSDTNDDWVVAAHDGVITVFSSCYIRITHESGWATDYYHLDNPLYITGTEVQAGQLIANYANNLAQATCQGGHSSGPHVHFSLLQDGERFDLDGIKFSKWAVHSGDLSYDSNHDRMWLSKSGIRK